MKLQEIDPSVLVHPESGLKELIWLDSKKKPFQVYGLAVVRSGEKFLRMPAAVAETVNPLARQLNDNTSGGRIRFRTNADRIAVKAVMDDSPIMAHITALGQSGCDLYRSDNGQYEFLGSFIPRVRDHGFEFERPTDGKWHTYTINMPLYDAVYELYIGLPSEAEIEESEPYTIAAPMIYYGSSITQGGCASRPGNSYQAIISRRFDADFINLGFSGSGIGDPTIADYIASLDASCLVLDYDHNSPSASHLRITHRPFYEKFRETHPDAPVVVVSKPNYRPHTEDDERREVIRDTCRYAEAQGDKKILFVDGASLFEGPCADSCTVDGAHPNDLGFFRMAVKIGDAIALLMGLA